MSRLAIQISVAAVFLTTVVYATTKPQPNPECLYRCEDKSQRCRQIRGRISARRICFNEIKPSGKKTIHGKPEHDIDERMAEAYLSSCSSKHEPNECLSCCTDEIRGGGFFAFKSYGEVHGESCLCVVIRQ